MYIRNGKKGYRLGCLLLTMLSALYIHRYVHNHSAKFPSFDHTLPFWYIHFVWAQDIHTLSKNMCRQFEYVLGYVLNIGPIYSKYIIVLGNFLPLTNKSKKNVPMTASFIYIRLARLEQHILK